MNFSEQPITKETIMDIINELIIFAIMFDLYTPPYDAVRQVTVFELQEKQSSSALRTGKRLGYFGSESDGSSSDEFNL